MARCRRRDEAQDCGVDLRNAQAREASAGVWIREWRSWSRCAGFYGGLGSLGRSRRASGEAYVGGQGFEGTEFRGICRTGAQERTLASQSDGQRELALVALSLFA